MVMVDKLAIWLLKYVVIQLSRMTRYEKAI